MRTFGGCAMSIDAIGHVWKHSKQSGTALLAMLALADFSDEDGRSYPSVNTLAIKTRVQPRNMQYLLKKLAYAGEIKISPEGSKFGTNLYEIQLGLGGVQPVAGGGAIDGNGNTPDCTPRVQSSVPPIIVYPSLEPSLNPLGLSPEEFIYQEYPRKAAKPAALKAILKALKKTPFEDLLAKTRLYTKVRGTHDPEFIPHPATWFNGQRFNDDPSTWERKQRLPSMSPWQERKMLEAKISTHPANDEWIGHDERKVTDLLKTELRNLRKRLSELIHASDN